MSGGSGFKIFVYLFLEAFIFSFYEKWSKFRSDWPQGDELRKNIYSEFLLHLLSFHESFLHVSLRFQRNKMYRDLFFIKNFKTF